MRNQHLYTCLRQAKSLPGTPSCGGVPGRPSWALSGVPSLSVGPQTTRPSLAPFPCDTLWNVLLVKENHNPFVGFSSSKVTVQSYTHYLFFLCSQFLFSMENVPKLQIPSQNFSRNN